MGALAIHLLRVTELQRKHPYRLVITNKKTISRKRKLKMQNGWQMQRIK